MRAALDRAAEQDVVVVALTVGASVAGRAMVAAHSGALAGADGAWEALFEAHNVVRVGDLDEMADTLELFAAGRRVPSGGHPAGIASVHDSGAERALVVDIASSVGRALRHHRRRHRGAVGRPARSGTGRGQPAGRVEHRFGHRGAVRRLPCWRWPRTTGWRRWPWPSTWWPSTTATSPIRMRCSPRRPAPTKPVVVLANLGSAIDEAAATRVRAGGVPVLEGTRSGLLALRHLMDHGRGRSAPTAAAAGATGAPTGRRRADGGPRLAGRAARGRRGLRTPGRVRDPGGREPFGGVVGRGGDRRRGSWATRWWSRPMSPAIAHKSDVGGVVLGRRPIPRTAAAAYADLARRLGPRVVVAAHRPRRGRAGPRPGPRPPPRPPGRGRGRRRPGRAAGRPCGAPAAPGRADRPRVGARPLRGGPARRRPGRGPVPTADRRDRGHRRRLACWPSSSGTCSTPLDINPLRCGSGWLPGARRPGRGPGGPGPVTGRSVRR